MNSILSAISSISLRDPCPSGKIEILQDLDLYYIKQLAHNFKEYDLEQRIALEIKMREGSTKLLAACGTQVASACLPQALEASRNLITSNERMTAYMTELQNRQTLNCNSRCTRKNGQPSLGSVCVSDLRLPLIWKDSDHFKNKGHYRRYSVFVLFKIGTEVYDTVMANPVDRSMTDICFDDIIVFNSVPPDFVCDMEIYSHVLQSDFSIASTPKKLRRSLHSSISRTVGRKLAATLRDELSSGDLGPSFDLVAKARLSLEDVSSSISTFDLQFENKENRSHQLPLFGHFCCRLAAQPSCITQERLSGYINIKEFDAKKLWCRVLGWHFEAWPSKEVSSSTGCHSFSLSVDKITDVCANDDLSFILHYVSDYDTGQLTFTFSSPAECQKWIHVLTKQKTDHGAWGRAADEDMEILTPQPTRHSFTTHGQGTFPSLYEETPVRERSLDSSLDSLCSNTFVRSYSTSVNERPPQSRNFTMNTRSSFRRWGSIRASMPFFSRKNL